MFSSDVMNHVLKLCDNCGSQHVGTTMYGCMHTQKVVWCGILIVCFACRYQTSMLVYGVCCRSVY